VPTNPEEMHSIRCSGCEKKLKYQAKLAGKKIACPKCGQSILLPLPNESIDLGGLEESLESDSRPPVLITKPGVKSDLPDDEDEFQLAPPGPVPRKLSSFKRVTEDLSGKSNSLPPASLPADVTDQSTKKGTSNLDLTDINLEEFDLKAVEPRPGTIYATQDPASYTAPSKGKTPSKLVEPSSPAKKTASKVSNDTRTEFRYPCKVCGTSMYAELVEVGNRTRCPDCYTAFSIPSPPPGWNKKKNVGPTSVDEGAAMPLAAAEGKGTRTAGPTASTAEVMMAKAEASLNENDEKTRNETYDFDASSWGLRNFGFLKDPSAIVIALVSGVFLGGALVTGLVISGMAADRTADLDQKESVRSVANNLTILLLATPLFLGCLANGIAVLEASANQLKQVARWPAFNLGEAMGEIMVVLAAFALAALPGGLLQWFGSMIGVPGEIATILWLLITWAAFPVFLLGMLDNQSATEPISKEVIMSIQLRHNAWGAMYMMTSMAFIGMFFLFLLQTNDRYPIRFVMGLVIPMMVFFAFHQYGLLAARISSVTQLGFESLDDEEVEDVSDEN